MGSNSTPVRQVMLNVNGDDSVQPDTAASDINGDDLVTGLADDHQRNGRMGPGKKSRGVEIDKEDSNENLSVGVLGSDSGRSNFVFVQGSNTVASEGRQSGVFAKHDEEFSDDKDLNEEAQVASVKSEAESDEASLADDNIEKHEGSMEHDPLVLSIKGLHSAQEEFEREVQKWKDVGKDDPLIFDDPILEILELKDAKIFELELALSGVKTELEDCLMQIIQADVENVVITTTTKRLTEGPLREIKHNLQQKYVASQGVQATNEKSETKEDLKKLQNRVCRSTSCFMIQLILLLVTLYLKYSPQSVEVVPT
ncbi:putative WPP domain-interacting protein/3 [Helianthus debilis subsp. tardiflorus]